MTTRDTMEFYTSIIALFIKECNNWEFVCMDFSSKFLFSWRLVISVEICSLKSAISKMRSLSSTDLPLFGSTTEARVTGLSSLARICLSCTLSSGVKSLLLPSSGAAVEGVSVCVLALGIEGLVEVRGGSTSIPSLSLMQQYIFLHQ